MRRSLIRPFLLRAPAPRRGRRPLRVPLALAAAATLTLVATATLMLIAGAPPAAAATRKTQHKTAAAPTASAVYPIQEGLADAHGVLIYYKTVGRGAPLVI